MWKKCTGKLKKYRFHYEAWEIDFFLFPNLKKCDKFYFALAEIELDEGQPRPKDNEIPKLILEQVLHSVKLNDNKFSNKKLGNIKHAAKLLAKLKKEKP